MGRIGQSIIDTPLEAELADAAMHEPDFPETSEMPDKTDFAVNNVVSAVNQLTEAPVGELHLDDLQSAADKLQLVIQHIKLPF